MGNSIQAQYKKSILHIFENELVSQLKKREEKAELRKLGFNFEKKFIDFFSNDYLGISQKLDLKNISKSYDSLVEKYEFSGKGMGATGSRLLSGNLYYIEKIEEKFSKSFNSDSALLFNSGYSLNLGLLSSLLYKESNVVIYDEFIHCSVRDGAKLGKGKSFSFRHNDLDHLERKLRKFRQNSISEIENIFVVVESLYSMDGDFAPLSEIVKLCDNYKALLIVDEAHAVGAMAAGGGLVKEQGLENKVLARVFPLGKSFGVMGAVILCSSTLKKYLINYARSLVYSTALTLPNYILIEQSLSLVLAGDTFRKQLLSNVGYIYEKLEQFKVSLGIQIYSDQKSHILSFNFKENKKTFELYEKLLNLNFQTNLIRSPTVRRGTERLRVCLHSFNTKLEIDSLLQVIEGMK